MRTTPASGSPRRGPGSSRSSRGSGRPEASDEPRDSGDQADDLQQEGTDDALREDLKQTLEAIERAEARLEEGTYGVSVVSGDPIPDERLEAVPWADRKVDEEPGGRG